MQEGSSENGGDSTDVSSSGAYADDEFGDRISNERRGTFVGTAYYVSPEMLKDNSCSPASDLWALGCTIFKMLTGNVPF